MTISAADGTPAPPDPGAGAPAPPSPLADARLQFALELAGAGFFEGDLRDGALAICERTAAFLGRAHADGPRTLAAFHAHIAASHRDEVLDALRAATRRGGPFEVDAPVATPDGEPRWVRVRGRIDHEDGRPVRTIGAMVEITQERIDRAREAERERFFRTLLDGMPYAVFVWEVAERRLAFANDRLVELLGYDRSRFAELADGGFEDLLHPEDGAERELHAALVASTAAGGAVPLLARVRHASGAWRWVQFHFSPLESGPDGRATRIVGTAEDVHERHLADVLRRGRERELEHAQTIARTGSWMFSFASEELTWSAGLCRIAGIAADVAPSQAVLEAMLDPADRDRLRELHAAAIAGGPMVDERVALHRRDGETRIVRVVSDVLRRADGTPEMLVGSWQDLTDTIRREEERARLQRQVQQSQKLESLGLLAGGIAHDFNNLLVGILANASLALLDVEDRPEVHAVVSEIERAAQRAGELTRQLLAYSGKGRFVIGPVDVGDLAREMASLLRSVVSKAVTLEVDTIDEAAVIDGDATQLRQVIMNLVTNASDACGEAGGTVRLTVRRGSEQPVRGDAVTFGEPVDDPGAACLVVRDPGAGMPPETIARIFDPFFTTKVTGRGLGLAATLGIVRGHKGAIEVWSRPGEGTQVVLRFPPSVSARPGAPAPDETATTGHGRILVVDDDVVVRTVARSLLARRGFEAVVVADGQSALGEVGREPGAFRAMLLDLTMAGLSGLEVARRVRDLERAGGHRALPIILMSGYSAEEIGEASSTLGLSGFLEKPFTLADLDRVLGHALRTP